MSRSPRPVSHRALVLGTIAAAGLQLAPSCYEPPLNERSAAGSQLFTSPQTNPVALACDGSVVYVANTTSGTLSIVRADAPYDTLIEVPVGLDPVGVAVRPKLDCGDPDEDEQILVTNHISDSISVVSARLRVVVQTVQELDANGVAVLDEPVGVTFHGNAEAFVTLDNPNQILKLEPDGLGRWSITRRTPLVQAGSAPAAGAFTAQAPRAIAAANGRVYVASFESGNQSEFPSCAAGEPENYDPNGAGGLGTGCEFALDFATILSFATNPNVGGEVVHNPNIPDRDLFVYDTDLNLLQTVTGVGTLLYGAVASGNSVYLTHTDARNELDGLLALGNRMFENKLARVDCSGSCSLTVNADLDANGFGVPVPTPYGVAVSGDGATLVLSVAGSDGSPPDAGDPSTVNVDIPGLLTVSASGAVQGFVRTGAIPQGLALRSDALGAAQTAYVLNTVDSTLSVVDVSSPATPALLGSVAVGSDPTAPEVKAGRIAFSSARASTSGTFSCESCHPNANIDQVDWTINTNLGPQDACNPSTTVCPEPRSTMPIRGLRDTLPLHWVGNLSDPFAGAGVGSPEDPAAPDCNLAVDGEIGCIRGLVDASLSGVMCEQSPGCPGGPSGQDGAFTDQERDDMAAFLAAVSFPPSPRRRPSDVLSASARDGVDDFFTDQGGLGAMLGGAAATCATMPGCHGLPLTVSTNSPVVGGFDAPSIRGLWDRHITFSNGITSTFENLNSVSVPGFGSMNPSATGMTEFGSLAATFPGLFTPGYNVPVNDVWSFINEMSVGLPGLLGRQISLDASNETDAGVGARLTQVVDAAEEGRITAVGSVGNQDWVYDPASDTWLPERGAGKTTAQLRSFAAGLGEGELVVTAHAPGTLVAGGAARQPLLSSPGAPNLATLPANALATIANVSQAYVDPAASVLVDGVRCAACSIALSGGTVDVTLSPTPATNGVHVLQLHNPEGFASNEYPFCINSGC